MCSEGSPFFGLDNGVHLRSLPAEVLQPRVGARIEQGHTLAGLRIECGSTVRFCEVAAGTGPGEVIRLIRAAAGSGQDVFDVKGGPLKRLVHATVFAPLPSSLL